MAYHIWDKFQLGQNTELLQTQIPQGNSKDERCQRSKSSFHDEASLFFEQNIKDVRPVLKVAELNVFVKHII